MLTINNIITLHRKQGLISCKSYYNNSSIWLLLCPNAYSLKKICFFLAVCFCLSWLFCCHCIKTSLWQSWTQTWHLREIRGGLLFEISKSTKKISAFPVTMSDTLWSWNFFQQIVWLEMPEKWKQNKVGLFSGVKLRQRHQGKTCYFKTKFGTNTHTHRNKDI